MKEELKALSDRIDALKAELASQNEKFLDEAFSDSDTIGMPCWLAQLAIDELYDYFSCVYGSYRHDGAWITPHSVTMHKYYDDSHYYSIDGIESEEYRSDWVSDIVVYDVTEISNFVSEYLNSDFPAQIESLLKKTYGCSDIDSLNKAICEWADENDYDQDSLEMDDIVKWIKDNNKQIA